MQDTVNNQTAIDGEYLVETIKELLEKIQKITMNYFQEMPLNMDEIFIFQYNSIAKVYQKVINKLLEDPAKIFKLQFSFYQDYFALHQKNMLSWIGKTISQSQPIDKNNKQFNDLVWDEHPLFILLKDTYLLVSKHILAAIDEIDDIDKKSLKKIRFYTRQFIDALSPNNFLVTNPDVLRMINKTGGKNLITGFKNLLDDIERGKGQLAMTMTDLHAFEVGKNIAITPGKVIYQNEIMQLIQYEATTPTVYAKPLLIIPPWINKYYILDLSEKNSFVKWLVEQGYTVFMISWVNPSKQHAQKDFADYMLEGPIDALNVIEKVTGKNKINALGFCIGGTLLSATLAYMAKTNDTRINSATYLATLIDFAEPGDIEIFIDEEQVNMLAHQTQKEGYLSGQRLMAAFNMLRANELVWHYFKRNYLQGEKPAPIDLLFWNSDSTNLPAKMVTTYLREMYCFNRLKDPQGIILNNVPIELERIQIPTYFLAAENDHIAPWKSVYAGTILHSGDITFVLGGSGHVAGIVNHPDNKKYYYYVNDKISKNPNEWYQAAKQKPGSWWTHWNKWLQKQSGEKIKARLPGGNKFKPLEDAPGSYVQVRLLEIPKLR